MPSHAGPGYTRRLPKGNGCIGPRPAVRVASSGTQLKYAYPELLRQLECATELAAGHVGRQTPCSCCVWCMCGECKGHLHAV
jgi:hypothetical protein